ncbi:YdcF family protein [Desertivirga xinjiangensis]|uniref:YdcF family protein n=1 Tax=Desertivirga xinjiangensis TaxID=539206 RepID=UPI00210C3E6B|nr:YdcF family protein [Pedobacter xinjiangensis]
MFHLLSKLLLIFIQPLTWALLLILVALLAKKTKTRKASLILSVLVLLIFSNGFLLNRLATAWDITSQPPAGTRYSCAIVLGGFSSKGPGSQYGHFNASADRFIQALVLWKQKKADRILVSGGNGHLTKSTFLEGQFAVEQLKKLQVPDSVILMESESKNTFENALYSKQLLKQKNCKGPFLLVTSAFHMRRALQTFKKAKLDVVPYPCDFKLNTGNVQADDFLPKAEVLSLWSMYIKEIIGVIAYDLRS